MLITKKPCNSVVTIIVLQTLAFFVPLFHFLVGSVVALFGFHYRALATRCVVLLLALFAVIAMMTLFILLGLFKPDSYVDVPIFILLYWLPPMIFTHIWRHSSLSLTAQCLGLFVIAGIGGAYLSVDNLPEMWRDYMYQHMLPANIMERASPDLIMQIDLMAESMTGVVAAVLVMSWLLWLLFGRWMQTLMEHPGTFRDEVSQYHMGVALAMAAVAVSIFWALDTGAIWKDFAVALGALFLLQGIITAHHILAKTLKNAKPWLMFFYTIMVISLFMQQYIIMLLIVLGVSDNFLHLRRRAIEYSSRKTKETNST